MSEQIRARSVALAIIVLCLSGCNQASDDYRVPPASVPLNAPLTGALIRTGNALPRQVTAINCFVPDVDTVSCDVELNEQSAHDMAQRTFVWRYRDESVRFAGQHWGAGAIRNMSLDAMASSKFQFVVRHDVDGTLSVSAGVDPSRIPIPAASKLLAEVVREIAGTSGPVFDAAHAATPAAIPDTWPASPAAGQPAMRSDVLLTSTVTPHASAASATRSSRSDATRHDDSHRDQK